MKDKNNIPYQSMIDKVIIALLTNPWAISNLKHETKNKKYFDKILYSLLPNDVGIEIEIPINKRPFFKNIELITYYLFKHIKKQSLLFGVHNKPLNVHLDGDIPEITHHMPKYKLYKHVWTILTALNNINNSINSTGGSIHYHIDISKYINWSNEYSIKFQHPIFDSFFPNDKYEKTKLVQKNKKLWNLAININKIMLNYYDFINNKIFEYDEINGSNMLSAKYNIKTDTTITKFICGVPRQKIAPRINEFGTIEFRMSRCILDYTRIMKEILIAQLLIQCAKKGNQFNYQLAKKIYNYSKSIRQSDIMI